VNGQRKAHSLSKPKHHHSSAIPSFSPTMSDHTSLFYNAVINRKIHEALALLRNHGDLINVNYFDCVRWTALHNACCAGNASLVRALLSRPDVKVNLKSIQGETPFTLACIHGRSRVVRLLLQDRRVDINSKDVNFSPLFWLACKNHLDTMRWVIASERILDLGTPGHFETDVLGISFIRGHQEMTCLLSNFKDNPAGTRLQTKLALGLFYVLAAKLFGLVVLHCDGYLRFHPECPDKVARFLSITAQLPMELQMVVCNRAFGSMRTMIPKKDSDAAFRVLLGRC